MRVQNGTIWLDGALADWEEARLPLMSDALLRGLSVFDGLVARRQTDGSLALLGAERHLDRLSRSCQVLGLPLEGGTDGLLEGCRAAAEQEAAGFPDCDVYIRPMVVGAVLTPRAREASVTVAAFRQEPGAPAPVTLQTSAWRRPTDDTLPPALKVVGNYQLTRLARLEAKKAGYDDALVLNAQGRVAESAGAAVVQEHGGRLSSPPPWEGCLDSVTVALLAAIARAEGIEWAREPLLRTTVLGADGLALAGTLADVVPVSRLDHRDYDAPSPLLKQLGTLWSEASRGGRHAGLLETVAV
ncbi:aminotransferase class IV [Streptomyces abyssomicinicus]|uniref:aminotransferase class IV n=1 Tax=Streptomyces abyssomicinicus TaxID=574929 RepID=UPI00124FFD2E|nr:aminotransferase class IV [Streptomyces abyssomicinicus]